MKLEYHRESLWVRGQVRSLPRAWRRDGIAQFSSSWGWGPGVWSPQLGCYSPRHTAQSHLQDWGLSGSQRGQTQIAIPADAPWSSQGNRATGHGPDSERAGEPEEAGRAVAGVVRKASLCRRGGSVPEERAAFTGQRVALVWLVLVFY